MVSWKSTDASEKYVTSIFRLGARGSLVVKALGYKLECRGFQTYFFLFLANLQSTLQMEQ
jgi:hypothetical protein